MHHAAITVHLAEEAFDEKGTRRIIMNFVQT